MHGGLVAHRLLLPARSLPTGICGVSRFSRMEFQCMLRVFDSAGPRLARAYRDDTLLPSRLPDAVGSPQRTISELHTQPTDSPVHRFRCNLSTIRHMALSNASSAASRPPSHGSGPGWLASLPCTAFSLLHSYAGLSLSRHECLRHIVRRGRASALRLSRIRRRICALRVGAHFVVEIPETDPQQLRGPVLVVLRVSQRQANVGLFHLVHRRAHPHP